MASHVKDNKCHLCDKVFDKSVDTVIDDEPFGLLCVRCEDEIYAQWMEVGDEYPLLEH